MDGPKDVQDRMVRLAAEVCARNSINAEDERSGKAILDAVMTGYESALARCKELIETTRRKAS